MGLRLKLFIAIFLCCSVFLILLFFSLADFYKNDRLSYIYEIQRASARTTALELNQLFLSGRAAQFEFEFQLSSNEVENLSIKAGEIETTAARMLAKQSCAAKRKIIWWTKEDKTLSYAVCSRTDSNFNVKGYSADLLDSVFQARGLAEFRLITEDGMVIIAPSQTAVGENLSAVCADVWESLNRMNGATEGRAISECNLLGPSVVTLVKLDSFPIWVLSSTSKASLDRALLPFIYKGLGSLFALAIVSIFTGLILSRSLTDKIKILLVAIQSFGRGESDARAIIQSKDEIGQLAENFNNMADHINSLVEGKSNQAAVEHEMSMASDIQRKFLGAESLLAENIQVRGYYEPAALCGGDWWFFRNTPAGFMICIGDVTGHGFNAALVTSAVRAVVSQAVKDLKSPAELVTDLNMEIFDSTDGLLQMTFFCGLFDHDFKRMHYCSASHEPVYFLNNFQNTKKEKFTKDDLRVLDQTHGPRLGQIRNISFEQSFIDLDGSTLMLCYTDGLRDILNSEAKIYGDRRMIKGFLEEASSNKKLDLIFETFVKRMRDFKADQPAPDDISFLMLLTKPADARVTKLII